MSRHRLIVASLVLVGFVAIASPVRANKIAAEACPPAVAAAANQLAVNLYRELASQDGNVMFSPYSVHVALAMAQRGAAGDTATQMADVIGLNLKPPMTLGVYNTGYGMLARRFNAPDKPFALAIANAMWVHERFNINPQYAKDATTFFDAEASAIDFGASEAARKAINDWVQQQTRDRIKDLMPQGSIDNLTRVVLTNAIYFKGDWARPFEADATRDAAFHAPGGDVQTPMMRQTEHFNYAEDDATQAISMPYKGNELSMLILLPRANDGLAALQKTLTAEAIAGWVAKLQSQQVAVAMPRFKMDTSYDLVPTLKKMGMTDAFDAAGADFSGISGSKDLYITAVVHKAFVEVNEKGTEAAAATGIAIGLRSARIEPEPKVFTADRPFVFAIRDNASGAILFMGRVVKPIAADAPAADEAAEADGDDAAAPATPERVETRKEWRGGNGGIEQAGNRVIDSAEAWKTAWAELHANQSPTPEVPAVDFDKRVVLAAFMGTRNSGGHSIRIAEVRRTGDAVEAIIQRRSPPPGGITTQALTAPYHMVVIDKPTLPIRFVDSPDDGAKAGGGFRRIR